MRTRAQNPFTTVTTSGLLLPVDMLTRIADGDPDLKGLAGKDYHLRSGERLNEAAARAWNQCVAAWKSFRKRFDALPASDFGTTTTRDEWLLPLFQELGYGRLQTKRALDFDGTEYPITHGWEDHVPIHLLSARLPLDRRTPGVSGAAARAPYSLMQELLNRSATHRWGFVTNGLKLFLLRDNAALARAANVEFDLEAMMDGEVYADFFLLFCLCHQSRVEIRGTGSEAEDAKPNPEDCWLEDWANQADQQGTRAREKLRDGVEFSIKSLGAGFLTTKGNDALRDRLRSGELSTQDFYRQLLRLVYRILMLLVAEEKRSESGQNLLHPPETSPEIRDRYARYYSVGRIRSLAYERRGTPHTDLYESLKVLFTKLRTGYAPLGIPGMGSFLFSDDSTPDLDDAAMANQDLLDAFRNLCYTEDTSGRGGGIRRPVDFGNLGSEELGSVYESLLELHPQIDTDEGPFSLGTAAGHERKTTGSYYTPRSLINCLLDSALDPVVNEAIDVPDPVEAEQKLLGLKVCDPACGSGHFLIAAADRMAMHLARIRTGDDQPNTIDIQHAKRDIIGRCIYGVDINPMAVELCKVSLWMEALEPGKPLSFLDHHIQCGNSLLGATPRLLAHGIPDGAFKSLYGDDSDCVSALRRQNKAERTDRVRGQARFQYSEVLPLQDVPNRLKEASSLPDDTVQQITYKSHELRRLLESRYIVHSRLLADAWCAAFVWCKNGTVLAKQCPTDELFHHLTNVDGVISSDVAREIQFLREQYCFFHWHVAFPEVFAVPTDGENPESRHCGWNGGFDAVIGNPPWEVIKVEQSDKDDPIRLRFISTLKTFTKTSGRFPLGSHGKANTMPLFAELFLQLLASHGKCGVIVKTVIATERDYRTLFSHIVEHTHLQRLVDVQNSLPYFDDVHRQERFSLMTISSAPTDKPAEYAVCLRTIDELSDTTKRFSLSADKLKSIGGGVCSLPSAETPDELRILIQQSQQGHNGCLFGSGWNVRFFKMLDTTEVARAEYTLHLSEQSITPPHMCPVYEGKLFGAYDHRYATYRYTANGPVLTETDCASKSSPSFQATPRFWMPTEIVEHKLRKYDWHSRWIIVYGRKVNRNNSRTISAAVLPLAGAVDTCPTLLLPGDNSARRGAYVVGLFNSFVFDYFVRQRLSGFTIGKNHLSLLLIPELSRIECEAEQTLIHVERLLLGAAIELSFPSWDSAAFCRDCHYDGPPFKFDSMRRWLVACEVDAAYFHLFGVRHSDVGYILDTFELVRRSDESKYGDYRTKRTILKIYDQMAEAIRTGQPYQTQLDPPPGPPTDAEGNFIPFVDWTDEIRNRYRDVIHIDSVAPPSEKQLAKPQQTTTLSRTTIAPDIAASSGGPFPSSAPQKLLVGLTADLVNRSPGALETTLREILHLALRPELIGKLIASENKQTELDAAVAGLPAEFSQLRDCEAPWSKVLQSLQSAAAIEVVSDGSRSILSPGENCGEVMSHFGTMPDAYMQLVDLAVEAYQSSATEELDREDVRAIEQARESWATETDG